MESVQSIIQVIFGGNITVQSILAVIIPIYAVAMSIAEWIAKKRLIKADKQLTSADKKLDAQRKELDEVKKGMQYLGDIICTAYLSNPNVDEATKKKIAVAATNLEQVANIKLSEMTSKTIDVVTEYIPGTNLQEQKENIVAEVKASEELIDTAANEAEKIVNKLEV
jgi:uncharacterized membrane-anchored protein YhcB (DUF1043 family)